MSDWHCVPINSSSMISMRENLRKHESCGGVVEVHTGMSRPIMFGEKIPQDLDCRCMRCGALGLTFVDDECLDFTWGDIG